MAVDSIYLDTEVTSFVMVVQYPGDITKSEFTLNKQEAYGTYQLFQTHEAFDFISSSFITRLFRIGLCSVTNAST